jgi:hypothetical protein
MKRQLIKQLKCAMVCPADDKEMARYIVAKIIWEEMQKHTDIRNLRWINASFWMYEMLKEQKKLNFSAFF